MKKVASFAIILLIITTLACDATAPSLPTLVPTAAIPTNTPPPTATKKSQSEIKKVFDGEGREVHRINIPEGYDTIEIIMSIEYEGYFEMWTLDDQLLGDGYCEDGKGSEDPCNIHEVIPVPSGVERVEFHFNSYGSFGSDEFLDEYLWVSIVLVQDRR